MLHRMICVLSAFLMLCVCPQAEDHYPVGTWESVDYVRSVDKFKPGVKSWEKDFYLKEFQCSEKGEVSQIGRIYRDGWVTLKDSGFRKPYYQKELEGETYLFIPWFSGRTTQSDKPFSYYVLKKVADRPRTPETLNNPAVPARKREDRSSRYSKITSVKAYDDVRFKDMRGVDFSGQPELPLTLKFNKQTAWPESLEKRGGCEPRRIMLQGMNPGLGVRELHRQGVTGKGVSVAIIDQPLYQDHPEYAGKIVAYRAFNCRNKISMHGPAVTSLLVGTHCGTAPEAKVYYAAIASNDKDAACYAEALNWLIDLNDQLPAAEKIRIVSVSAAPSGPGTLYEKNTEMWEQARAYAEARGMMVLDCTEDKGFIGRCYYHLDDPDDLSKCRPGRRVVLPSDRILVPSSRRTTAEVYWKGQFSYQYCGNGGSSWSIPYCAGVLAMGWQIRPDLDAGQMKDCLFNSAFRINKGGQVINPKEFIRVVKSMPKTKS